MTAKEFLGQAWHIDRRIERRKEERDRLLARLTAGRTASLTGMPRGGGSDWTNAVSRVIEMEREINAEIVELCRVKSEVNAAISQVQDVRYRELLELRYRNYYSWDKIAREMNFEVRHIYRLHGEALLCVRVPTKTCH